MSNPRQPNGDHTWKLFLGYVRCPFCGYIMENRDPFEKHFNTLVKEVLCQRCDREFTLKK